ncbi:MAG: hypothetical protein FGM15_04055 [Chthoniobacterales bacterium]|nr:hypothetical protein [Chthoniobacterales bacterium]
MNEKELLRRTARSFALTLGLLPQSARSEASLAYLLARGTDTIADQADADSAQRAGALRSFLASLGRTGIEGYDAEEWSRSVRDDAASRLLARMPELWRRMQSLENGALHRVRTVIGCILEGQIFDVERFFPDSPPLAGEELSRYTYLVAGSAGEFLTDLCAAHQRDFSADPLPSMRDRARSYGEALQLVNILRDRRMDAALGRVYLENRDVPRAMETARTGLAAGGDYCAALRSGRLRYALLLPALLGLRTLALLGDRGDDTLAPRKVPRREVRQWLLRALPVWFSPGRVRGLVARAAGADVTAQQE